MSTEAIAIIGAAVGMLAVLVPLLLTLAAGIRRELDQVRSVVAEVRHALQALTTRVDSLAERVARIEGALTGPWRPANGAPAASTQGATATD